MPCARKEFRMQLRRLVPDAGRGRRRWLLACLVAIPVFGVAGGSASANVPTVDIGSASGPLTQVAVGADLSCQTKHTGDAAGEWYPPSGTPADCGTFMVIGGNLFAPDFNNHDGGSANNVGSYTPWASG